MATQKEDANPPVDTNAGEDAKQGTVADQDPSDAITLDEDAQKQAEESAEKQQQENDEQAKKQEQQNQ
jgi:hypothetical protein